MHQAKDLRLLVSKNLRFFMGLRRFKSANALAVAAGVAPGTVRNYLDPRKRTTTSDKPEGYPVLDLLGKLAVKLECDVWELLHPDIEQSLRERDMYRKMETSFKLIQSPEAPAITEIDDYLES